MPFLEFPNGAKVTVHFHGPLGGWNNILWFTKSAFTSEDLLELVDTLDLSLGLPYKALMSNDGYYDYCTGYDMRTIDGITRTSVVSAGVGTVAEDILPIQSAVVLTLRTLYRGRSARGRLYLTGFGKDQVNNNAYASGLIDDLLALFEGLIDDVAAIGWTWVVASKQEDGVPRSAMIGRQIVDVDVRTGRPGSQRRRTGRV